MADQRNPPTQPEVTTKLMAIGPPSNMMNREMLSQVPTALKRFREQQERQRSENERILMDEPPIITSNASLIMSGENENSNLSIISSLETKVTEMIRFDF